MLCMLRLYISSVLSSLPSHPLLYPNPRLTAFLSCIYIYSPSSTLLLFQHVSACIILSCSFLVVAYIPWCFLAGCWDVIYLYQLYSVFFLYSISSFCILFYLLISLNMPFSIVFGPRCPVLQPRALIVVTFPD